MAGLPKITLVGILVNDPHLCLALSGAAVPHLHRRRQWPLL
jgi:hypothetical protein